MSKAEILRLIETVSPDDTAKLDEIDARVWGYINQKEIMFRSWDHSPLELGCPHFKGVDRTWYLVDLLDDENWQYTRSRDALKAIRPGGYFSLGAPDWKTEGRGRFDKYAGLCASIDNQFESPAGLATEELAELHAIISAIDFERQQS